MIGSVINHRELLDRIYLVDDVDWSEEPLYQARRGTHRNDASPGRTANGSDFVWYDP